VKDIVQIFEDVIGNVKELAIMWILQPINIFLQLFPIEALPYLQNVLNKILILLLTSQESDSVKVHYISIFARCLIGNKDGFFAFFRGLNNPNIFFNFLDIWLDKADSISSSLERKLTALALSNLLPTNDPQLLKYLGLIINVCTGIIYEQKKSSNDQEYDKQIPFHSVAQEQLIKSDPVLQANLHAFLMQKLNESAQLNREAFDQAIQNNVDSVVFNQLQSFNLSQQ